MVPKYPFVVKATYRNGGTQLHEETHNYEMLAAAQNYKEICIRKPKCVRVQVLFILDESLRTDHAKR